jgi:RNA polymerase sigma-70 factor (ECF subfamily)
MTALPAQAVGEDASRRSVAAPMTFGDIYDAHAPFVVRNVRRLVGLGGPIDDLVQEVFLRVLQGLGDFEGRAAVRTWLYTILRNVVYEHFRANGKKGKTRDSVDLEELPDQQAKGPQAAAERTQSYEILYELLAKLDETRREVLVLADIEQMSAPEIAEALGIKVTTVHARLRTAREEFEALVRRYDARWRRP